MGCTFSQGKADRKKSQEAHAKLKQALETCTADPHNILKMDPEPELKLPTVQQPSRATPSRRRAERALKPVLSSDKQEGKAASPQQLNPPAAESLPVSPTLLPSEAPDLPAEGTQEGLRTLPAQAGTTENIWEAIQRSKTVQSVSGDPASGACLTGPEAMPSHQTPEPIIPGQPSSSQQSGSMSSRARNVPPYTNKEIWEMAQSGTLVDGPPLGSAACRIAGPKSNQLIQRHAALISRMPPMVKDALTEPSDSLGVAKILAALRTLNRSPSPHKKAPGQGHDQRQPCNGHEGPRPRDRQQDKDKSHQRRRLPAHGSPRARARIVEESRRILHEKQVHIRTSSRVEHRLEARRGASRAAARHWSPDRRSPRSISAPRLSGPIQHEGRSQRKSSRRRKAARQAYEDEYAEPRLTAAALAELGPGRGMSDRWLLQGPESYESMHDDEIVLTDGEIRDSDEVGHRSLSDNLLRVRTDRPQAFPRQPAPGEGPTSEFLEFLEKARSGQGKFAGKTGESRIMPETPKRGGIPEFGNLTVAPAPHTGSCTLSRSTMPSSLSHVS